MKRRHLVELHELPWYPASWRRMFQDTLAFLITRTGAYDGVAAPFAALLDRVDAQEVLDLCSGSSDPVIRLCERVRPLRTAGGAPRVYLSDLFPNVARFSAHQRRHPDHVAFIDTPVDAMAVPGRPDLPKIRTVFSALHHFRPEQVRHILTDAAQHADGFAAFECTERRWRNLASTLMMPLAATVVASLCLRPWRPRHVLWGAIIPVVPLTLTVDSVVSNLRTYTTDELRAIVAGIDAPDFVWDIGTAPIPGAGLHATYVLGWRQSKAERTIARRTG